MTKATTSPTEQTMTGLMPSEQPRAHYDIYAILEATQEMYFGEEVAVNVNLVEQVKVPRTIQGGTGFEELAKCYLSPTKRRGVERRILIWAPTRAGVLLGDLWKCGIPATCARQECPICSVYGALQPQENISLVGRITHSGGVAIQPLLPEVKQRAMHPSIMTRQQAGQERITPVPYKREYNEPALIYPIYNHCFSLTEEEFSAAAYAFLNALSRLGAGNPKGVRLAEGLLHTEGEPLLVVDQYLAPLGKRPTISPQETNPAIALQQFREAAFSVFEAPATPKMEGEAESEPSPAKGLASDLSQPDSDQGSAFRRWIGDRALHHLQAYSLAFTQRVLLSKEA